MERVQRKRASRDTDWGRRPHRLPTRCFLLLCLGEQDLGPFFVKK